ncbi:MAG: tRNA (guanosine(46)-N7)-methyltransferase TrmB [Clostridia bacterium]|nr:tRNA (guanosine(46)-N7)-methyltransferase TrmB [Clostridia bacterium]
MRARKKKNTPGRLEKYAELFLEDALFIDPSAHNALEIGCGKGAFLAETAAAHPDCFYIGVEKVPDVIAAAAVKADEKGVKNVRFMMKDAATLGDLIPERSIDVIYLNFSDPWPPNKRRKRRLTYGTFLDIYKKLLKPGGRLEFKTDNDKLFDFTVEELGNNGFETVFLTRDLHSENVENIMTEYEKRFSDEGIPIKKLVAVIKE